MRWQFLSILIGILAASQGCESSPALSVDSVKAIPSDIDAGDLTHEITLTLHNRTPHTHWVLRNSLGPWFVWIDRADPQAEEKPCSFSATFYHPQPLRPGDSWSFTHWARVGEVAQISVDLFDDELSVEQQWHATRIWSERVAISP